MKLFIYFSVVCIYMCIHICVICVSEKPTLVIQNDAIQKVSNDVYVMDIQDLAYLSRPTRMKRKQFTAISLFACVGDEDMHHSFYSPIGEKKIFDYQPWRSDFIVHEKRVKARYYFSSDRHNNNISTLWTGIHTCYHMSDANESISFSLFIKDSGMNVSLPLMLNDKIQHVYGLENEDINIPCISSDPSALMNLSPKTNIKGHEIANGFLVSNISDSMILECSIGESSRSETTQFIVKTKDPSEIELSISKKRTREYWIVECSLDIRTSGIELCMESEKKQFK